VEKGSQLTASSASFKFLLFGDFGNSVCKRVLPMPISEKKDGFFEPRPLLESSTRNNGRGLVMIPME